MIIKKDIDLNQFKLSNIKGNICETGVDDIAHADLTFDNKRKGDKQYPMDVYFYYGTGTFEKFQARNFLAF